MTSRNKKPSAIAKAIEDSVFSSVNQEYVSDDDNGGVCGGAAVAREGGGGCVRLAGRGHQGLSWRGVHDHGAPHHS